MPNNCGGRTRSVLRRLTVGNRGQAVVEFALLVPIVLLLLSAMLEVGRLYHTRLSARHITVEAARFAATGRLRPDASGERMLGRVESIHDFIRVRAEHSNVQVDTVILDPADGGGPGEELRVTAAYRHVFTMPLIGSVLPSTVGHYQVSTTMKNEPFN